MTLTPQFQGSVLTIASHSLVDQSIYTIIATAATSTKNTTVSIELQASSAITRDIQLPDITDFIKADQPLALTPKLTLSENKISFNWIFSPALNSSISIELNSSYLIIPANSLLPGSRYKITLEISSPNEATLSAYILIKVNSPSVCDSLMAFQNSNKKWTLTGKNCYDPDTNNILTYQFASINNQDIQT